MSLADLSLDLLWRNALGAIPLAIAVLAICRLLPCRAATRHALWVIVLLSLVAPPIVPRLNVDGVLQSIVSKGNPKIEGPQAPAQPQAAERTSLPTPNPLPDVLAAPTSNPAPELSPQPARAVDAEISSSSTTVEQITGVTGRGAGPDQCADDAGTSSSVARNQNPQKPARTAQAQAPIEVSSSTNNPVESPTSPSSSFMSSDAWRQWIAQMIALRNAIASLPPIPIGIWLIGSSALLIVLAIRTIRFRRLLHNATHPTSTTIQEVAFAARTIGLSAVPETMMIRHRVSPLIWCGQRRLLLLPVDLWNELDELGRRAVLVHELAHLRRRDHWVRWVELIIGCAYWWHPLVWFIRRKLRDEADACCDAWVTAFLPNSRRAYAQALLATRQFIGESPIAVPAVGLGVTTVHAKQLARRITMVMTQKQTPRLSIYGSALAIFLGAAGWLSAPLWACPPESGEKKIESGATTIKLRAPKAVTGAVMAAPTPAPSPQPGTTYERYMQNRDGDQGMSDRINRLEERLNRLGEQLERLMQSQQNISPRSAAPMGGGGGVGGLGGARAGRVDVTTPSGRGIMVAPAVPAQPGVPAPPAMPAMPRQPAPPAAPSGVTVYGGPGGGWAVAQSANDSNEVIIRGIL